MATVWGTGDTAEVYLRREALNARIKRVFRGLSDGQLRQVSDTAELAIDTVFGARRLDQADQDRLHGEVHDYAECAALYGFALALALVREGAVVA